MDGLLGFDCADSLINPYPTIREEIKIVAIKKGKVFLNPSFIKANITTLTAMIQKLTPKTPDMSDIWIIMLNGQTRYPTANEGNGRKTSDMRVSRLTHKKHVHKQRTGLLNSAFKPSTTPGTNKL